MILGRYILFYLLKQIYLVAIFGTSSAVKSENLNAKAKLCGDVQAGPRDISDFKKYVLCRNHTYIDKTLFIRDALVSFTGILLLTRPPKFGKTLLLSTLNYYFNFRLNDSENLFSGFNIAKYTAFKNRHMHKYAVILVDFSAIKHESYSGAIKCIRERISRAFSDHDYLLGGNILSESEKKSFRDHRDGKVEREEWLAGSVEFLCECLEKYFKDSTHTIIMIDEYDTPLHTSYANNYYVSMIDFLSDFYHTTLKSNTKFCKAVIMGVTSTGRENVLLDMFIVIRTTFEDQFSDYFGFTGKEVALLTKRVNKGDEIRKRLETRYRGYQFGNKTIFNPYSVIFDLFENKPFAWANSESTQTLEIVLKSHGLYPVLTLQRLLAHETVTKIVYETLVYEDISTSEGAYWAYLINLGYLTVGERPTWLWVNDWNATLRIPNQELELSIKKALNTDHAAGLTKIPSYSGLVDNLVAGNFTLAKPVIESYIKDAGLYFKRSGENYNARELTTYVTELLNGVALRYHSDVNIKETPGKVDIEILPKNNEGCPIFVVIQEATKLVVQEKQEEKPSTWRKIKNSLCSFLKPGDKNKTEIIQNKTEIVIQYTNDVLEVCLTN